MAAVDYFLKIEGIEGEAKDDKHKNQIEIESFSWGAVNSGTHSGGGGGGAGKVAMQDAHFVMRVNKASPKLMLACASGEHISKAVLTCRKAGKDQQDYLVFKFSDLLVSSYQTGGSGGSNVVPTDQISSNFSKIEYEYKEQKQDGSLHGGVATGWNINENKKV